MPKGSIYGRNRPRHEGYLGHSKTPMFVSDDVGDKTYPAAQALTVRGIRRSVQGTPEQAVNRTNKTDKEPPSLGVITDQIAKSKRGSVRKKTKVKPNYKKGQYV